MHRESPSERKTATPPSTIQTTTANVPWIRTENGNGTPYGQHSRKTSETVKDKVDPDCTRYEQGEERVTISTRRSLEMGSWQCVIAIRLDS